MPSYFFDSSAIVKRYHQEPGSNWVRAVCDPRTRPPLYVSQLAQVEVVAALRRAGRRANFHASYVASMVNTFGRHLMLSDPARRDPMYRLVPLTSTVMAIAAMLCNTHWLMQPNPLRSLDAIQLACALATAANLSDELLFVTADKRLLAIAPLEGLLDAFLLYGATTTSIIQSSPVPLRPPPLPDDDGTPG
ncbi:MAG: type II toxin-antitoxin system VapC family toxin [Ktedonobacterales bacterium]